MCAVSNRESRYEGTGTRPDYLVNRADKKIEGPLGEKLEFARKSRNSCWVNGWGCGLIGTVDSGLKCAQFWNHIQTLQEFLYCNIYCAHLGTPWHSTVTTSLAVSNRESRYSQYPQSFRHLPCRWLFCHHLNYIFKLTVGENCQQIWVLLGE